MQKVTESVLNLNEILTSLKETIHMKAQGEKKKKGKRTKRSLPKFNAVGREMVAGYQTGNGET